MLNEPPKIEKSGTLNSSNSVPGWTLSIFWRQNKDLTLICNSLIETYHIQSDLHCEKYTSLMRPLQTSIFVIFSRFNRAVGQQDGPIDQ